MSDHLYIEKGRSPWKPSESGELVEVFHRFTIPLVGLIEQHGVQYLFWCVVGHAGPESAWAYARVDEGSMDLGLLRAATHENLAEALADAVRNRTSAFAIASEDKGIVEHVEIDPPASLDDVHARGMSGLAEKVNDTMAEMKSLLEQFPSIRAVTAFSIAPTPIGSAL